MTNCEVQTRKEVILAAGALLSPRLLEIPGIGDSKLLQSLEIVPVIENPNLGENLQDHLMSGISYEVNEGVMTRDPLLRQDPQCLQMGQQLYAEHKAGPLATGGIGSHAFILVSYLIEEGHHDFTDASNRYTPKTFTMQSNSATCTLS